ncbi:MAG: hypothetical protein ACOC0U_00560 [Desulfovibrionales bacterium]
MDVNKSELKSKLVELYPEIEQHGIAMDVYPDEQTDTWKVSFKKDENELETHLEKKDVEGCLGGKECAHLGVQLGRFVKNYCLRDNVCPTRK